MFIAVYRFKIKPATKEAFIQAWKTHMEGIYLVLGSLGSRLHKEEKTGDYIGYAQWPNKTHWENSDFNHLNSEEYLKYKKAGEVMCKTIISSDTILELDVEADYLQSRTFLFE